jgi:hypothetical protein
MHHCLVSQTLSPNFGTSAAETKVFFPKQLAHVTEKSLNKTSSGTPFLQMATAESAAGRQFRYAVAGISVPNNTRALFNTAARLGVEYLTDEQCQDAATREHSCSVSQSPWTCCT